MLEVLDDYSVHLMPEVRKALLDKGYVIVIIGGGITGDLQINDTHFHDPIKTIYRDQEMGLMLQQLENNSTKVPSPSRDKMMPMMVTAISKVTVNTENAFKSLFLTNFLDGSKDFKVLDKLYKLVGSSMVEFRAKLMETRSPKTLQEQVRSIIPPKGVKRRPTIEGGELFDCENNEIEDEEHVEDNNATTDGENETPAVSATNVDAPCVSRITASLSTTSKDPDINADINADAAFLDELEELLMRHQTSKLLTPFVSQLKVKRQKVRRSVRKRIQHEVEPSRNESTDVDINIGSETPETTPTD